MARTKKDNAQNTINIKSMPVQAHIGASKYVNDDWGTIAFIIPRNQLQLKFSDKELRYDCIYFLFGYEGTAEKVYVGQAKKRNNGESVLARLREHDTSTTEKYCDIWEWVVVCTGKEDTWSLDDLNALEHAFYNEIPSEQSLNGNNPNSGGANYEAYTDKIKQIENYITSIGFNIFADNEDTEKIQVTSEINENTIVEDLQNGLARIPEIVTPHKVVKAMCDMLPPEVWNDQTVFLDPACKGGEYLREIYDRLMDSEIMQVKYPDEFERSNHILGKQLYGIALSRVSLERTTKKLRGYDHNLRVIPNYIRKLKGIGLGSRPDGTSKTIQDILNEEFNKDMKFDVVIGNPPYNEFTGKGTQSKPLYNIFVENAVTMCRDIVSMIIPSKYFGGGIGLNSFRDYVRLNKNLKKYVHYIDAKECFKGVEIAGGVGYFIIDKNYTGKCEFASIVQGEAHSKMVDLSNYNFIIGNIKNLEIIDKVLNQCKRNMCEVVHPLSLFALPTDIALDWHTTEYKQKDTDLKIWYTRMQSCYADRSYITNGKEYIDKYCAMIGAATSEHGNASPNSVYKVLTSVFVKQPGEVCTQAYIAIGGWNNKIYAENCLSYLRTRFVRFLLQSALSSIRISSDKFCFVPLEDFSQTYTDEILYKKYNLTQGEIGYIEKTIKPMN